MLSKKEKHSFLTALVLFPLIYAQVIPSVAIAGDLKIWTRQPADDWTQALPIGNGRLGAMVFGGIRQEHLSLNDDTMWSGRPRFYGQAGAYKYLPEVRRLLFEGRFTAAEAIVKERILGERPINTYQVLGDLFLEFEAEYQGAVDYTRELDIAKALITITYRVGDVVYKREIFASNPDQVIVVRLTCNRPGMIGFQARLSRIADAEVAVSPLGHLVLAGRVDKGKPTEGVGFQAHLKVQAEGGKVEAREGSLKVVGADAATLLLASATSYRHQEPQAVCHQEIAAAAEKSYPRLLERHIEDYQALFNRVQINLSPDGAPNTPTDRRQTMLADGHYDQKLLALYYQYGRYLLISSSRPGTMAANLVGIWTAQLDPAWFGGYHFNMYDIQANYWPAEATGLPECAEPLFDLIENLRQNGHRTAREVYNCRGWTAAHRTDGWWFTSPVHGLTIWPTGGALLCRDLWEHYLYSADRKFLAERAWPTIKEAAEFHLDWLVENPKTGKLVSGPSHSPENQFITPEGQKASLIMGPAMDQQIIWELFTNCLEAAKILGIEDNFIKEVRDKRGQMDRGLNIGSDGRLMEWPEEYKETEIHHRHISHLFALHPSNQISLRETPRLALAARKSIEARGDVMEFEGKLIEWGGAIKCSLWARLHESEKAHRSLLASLKSNNPANLLPIHPRQNSFFFVAAGVPGNTAAMTEMLLQSYTGEIELLPALPEAWKDGYVKGLCARGGYEVDIYWKSGKLSKATIRSRIGGKCRVRYGENTVEFETKAGQSYTVDDGLRPD